MATSRTASEEEDMAPGRGPKARRFLSERQTEKENEKEKEKEEKFGSRKGDWGWGPFKNVVCCFW